MSWQLLVSGLIVHLILIYSIFDIYYTSPVVVGVPSHEITQNGGPAKRLVVFSADGLRLDTFTNNPDKSKFLHGVIRYRKGVSGISRSHVPTESRPGHVAIFAGFTEDVSAVARGWKNNPVQFDSVFNRSKEAWLWGSPDIVSLFDEQTHVHSFSYSEELEDFDSNEAYKLDDWVFDSVEKFLKDSKENPEAWENMQSDGKVFFLHLLGLDTNGHGNKPRSKQYIDNIAVVDIGVRRISMLFEAMFPDAKTAYLFTADHGMTDWGSHGAGSDEEVLTPFVAWGAGLQKGGPRKTISQVDLSPLMSSLLGLPVPVNSVGVLPIQLMNVSPTYLFQSTLANFLQLKEQLLALRNEKAKRLWFREFDKFGDKALLALEQEMHKSAKLGRFAAAATLFVENAHLLKQAIFHYHRYDRGFLGASISALFVAWVSLVWCYLTRDRSLPLFTRESLEPQNTFKGFLVAAALFCLYCRLPWTNFIYVLLPIYIFSFIENTAGPIAATKKAAHECIANYATTSFTFLVMPFVSLISLSVCLFVFVIVFLDRRFLSVIFFLLIFVPDLYESTSAREWSRFWRVCCVLLLPFPFMPVVGGTEYPSLCVLAPILFVAAIHRFVSSGSTLSQISSSTLLTKAMTATALMVFISSYLYDKPPLIIRALCWCSLPASLVLPLFTPLTIHTRTTSFLGALFIPYALLSISYESLFILFFLPLLLLFLRFEYGHVSDVEFLQLPAVKADGDTRGASARIVTADVRQALICVCFVLSALFGTGNFASMNSFNPSSLRRFISVFSPFTMAALIISKLILPLLMITLVLAAALRFERAAMQRLSCLVLIITDLMAMCFFHQLKDEGSWLDIGLSISQYLVAMCISIGLLLLLLGSSGLATTSLTQLSTTSFTKKEDKAGLKDCHL